MLSKADRSTDSASRIFIGGGIALIAAGMLFGDIFAVFVLHQNADRIGDALTFATDAITAENVDAAFYEFGKIGGFLENRGTKVDTHVHITDFGYLGLLIALIQPFVTLQDRTKRRLAYLFLIGAVMLPVSVFLIHYVGLKYSPLRAIGWASITADFGGLLVIIAAAGELIGISKFLKAKTEAQPRESDTSWPARALLVGGSLLVLAGFLHGVWYAAFDLDKHEQKDREIIATMIQLAVSAQQSEHPDVTPARGAVQEYGLLQADKAVKIAAHSHIIEFGLLALLLAFIQRFVMLSEPWRRRWVIVYLAGSLILPVFVLLELQLGLLAGGIADAGGLLVIIALVGMFVGVIRPGGAQDSREAVQ